MKIGCIVMAAGNARRFGSNKLDARVEGKTLLRRALEAVPVSCFTRVAVVTQYPQGMELARELRLPVIVHEREAHGDALCILADFPDVTGVFHCYSGAWEMAQLLLKRGWYLGFTGVITFKNARRAVEVVENAPLHRLLIETDCPYMAPEPFRGQRSDPSMVPRMAAKIAEIKGVTPEEAGRVTAENARRLFRIDPEHS